MSGIFVGGFVSIEPCGFDQRQEVLPCVSSYILLLLQHRH